MRYWTYNHKTEDFAIRQDEKDILTISKNDAKDLIGFCVGHRLFDDAIVDIIREHWLHALAKEQERLERTIRESIAEAKKIADQLKRDIVLSKEEESGVAIEDNGIKNGGLGTFELVLAPESNKSKVWVNGNKLNNVAKVSIKQKAGYVPVLKLDLSVSSSDIKVVGKGIVILDNILLSSADSKQLYENLKSYYESEHDQEIIPRY